jgi:hypothetical protein
MAARFLSHRFPSGFFFPDVECTMVVIFQLLLPLSLSSAFLIHFAMLPTHACALSHHRFCISFDCTQLYILFFFFG